MLYILHIHIYSSTYRINFFDFVQRFQYLNTKPEVALHG